MKIIRTEKQVPKFRKIRNTKERVIKLYTDNILICFICFYILYQEVKISLDQSINRKRSSHSINPPPSKIYILPVIFNKKIKLMIFMTDKIERNEN